MTSKSDQWRENEAKRQADFIKEVIEQSNLSSSRAEELENLANGYIASTNPKLDSPNGN